MMQRRKFLASLTALAGMAVLPRDWARLHRALGSDQTPAATSDAPQPFDVYLTFDDGPFANEDLKTGPTDVVLQILSDHSASATFFLHGRHILPWHGPVLARYVKQGHTIGNHLWSQGGNTTVDHPTFTRLAYQYLLTDDKIRTMLQAADQDAYNAYLAQGKMFRRPGGSNYLAEFLDPANFHAIEYDPLLRPLGDKVQWLKSVYDYSGWHVNGGESIPVNIRPTTPDEERNFILHGGNGYYGIEDYLQFGNPPRRSLEADAGLIILMHDADKDTDSTLPQLLDDLTALGARFRSLPRPGDQPNTKSVGVGNPPKVA